MTNYTRENYKTSLFNYIQFPLLSYHQCYKIRIHWNFHFYFFWQIMFSRYFQVVFYLLMNHFLGFYIKRFPSIHSFDKQKKHSSIVLSVVIQLEKKSHPMNHRKMGSLIKVN